MCMCVSDHVATTLLWRHVEYISNVGQSLE